MKKMFMGLLAIGCLLAAPSAKAQNINEICPNEISFSYGVSLIGAATANLINTFELVEQFTDGDYIALKSGGSKGVLNLGYIYHFNKVVGLGGHFGFNRISANLSDNTGQLTAVSVNVYSMMVDAKLNWFRYDIFGMYSKIGLGAMCLNTNLVEEYSGNIWAPTAHVSLIGMEVGRQFSGFLELGAGMKGIAQFGVKFHF